MNSTSTAADRMVAIDLVAEGDDVEVVNTTMTEIEFFDWIDCQIAEKAQQ